MENNGWFPKETAPKDASWFVVIKLVGGQLDEEMCWSPYAFASWFIGDNITYYSLSDGFQNGKNGYFGGEDVSDEIAFDWWKPLSLPNL